MCERLGLHASFFAGDDWYAWGPDQWTEREATITAVDPSPESAHDYVASGRVDTQPPHKVMAMGDPALVDELEAALAGRDGTRDLPVQGTYLEIANADCSKGDGLRALAGELGIDVADTVFFGDNHNDVSAFAVAGTAVAVSNAVEPALDAATVVTGHHREDGVAEYLEDWLAIALSAARLDRSGSSITHPGCWHGDVPAQQSTASGGAGRHHKSAGRRNPVPGCPGRHHKSARARSRVRGTRHEPITLRLAWTTTGRQTDAGNRARRSAVG